MRSLVIAALLGAALLGASSAVAYSLRGSLLGNGGTRISGSGRQISGTAGQPAVGRSAGATHVLCHGFWCFGGSRVVAVENPPIPADLPDRLGLGTPFPNPAREGATFVLALPQPSRIALSIHDASGRAVRRIEAALEAGWKSVRWDGTDESGRRLDSGVYFARLAVDGVRVGARRIVIRR